MNSIQLLEPDKLCRDIWCEKNYVFKWIIHNFSCHKSYAEEDLPTKAFQFSISYYSYTANIKFLGQTCKERKIKVALTKHSQPSVTLELSLPWKTIVTFMLNSSSISEELYENDKCLLPKDNVTILLKFSIWVTDGICGFTHNNKPQYKLNCNLQELFKNKKYWDVMFVVAGQEIQAHKCILASRSKVFAAMFEHELEETKSNKVIITDIDTEVFEEILRYIYTDEVININKFASELLAASEKYDLENLKGMCEKELANSVTIENAAEKLIIADLNRSEDLKQHIIRFINCRSQAISITKGWKDILENYSHLLQELYLNK